MHHINNESKKADTPEIIAKKATLKCKANLANDLMRRVLCELDLSRAECTDISQDIIAAYSKLMKAIERI